MYLVIQQSFKILKHVIIDFAIVNWKTIISSPG